MPSFSCDGCKIQVDTADKDNAEQCQRGQNTMVFDYCCNCSKEKSVKGWTAQEFNQKACSGCKSRAKPDEGPGAVGYEKFPCDSCKIQVDQTDLENPEQCYKGQRTKALDYCCNCADEKAGWQGYDSSACGRCRARRSSSLEKQLEENPEKDLDVSVSELSESDREAKFLAHDFILADSLASAAGIEEALGLADKALLASLIQKGWEPIETEWLALGDADDEANYNYIRYGKARETRIPPMVSMQLSKGQYHGGSISDADFDMDHDGMTLRDFAGHPNSKLAQLDEQEVFALRAYTSGSFPRFNGPLRRGEKPHPLKMTVYYLNSGLKKLRQVEASKDRAAYMRWKFLYRGMKDMTLDADKFATFGGTELACMSTTEDRDVAVKYATSQCPLFFRYKTRGNSRGVAIKFLSLFPQEEEFLYPPLTLLASDGPPTEEDGMRVFDVTPMMS